MRGCFGGGGAPHGPAPTAALKVQLLDTTRSLYDRYKAMFALRDRGDEESVLALTAGLEDRSALFRHEIAFVLGQLAHTVRILYRTWMRRRALSPQLTWAGWA